MTNKFPAPIQTEVDKIDLSMFEEPVVSSGPAPIWTLTTEYIQSAYNALELARRKLTNAINSATSAKEAYDDGERDAWNNELVQGKNAEQRAADLAKKLAPHIQMLRDAKRTERNAQLEFDIARDEVDRIKTLLQAMAQGAGSMPVVINQLNK